MAGSAHKHIWHGLTRLGNIVIGISFCQLCKKKADAEDRLHLATRRLREFNERAS